MGPEMAQRAHVHALLTYGLGWIPSTADTPLAQHQGATGRYGSKTMCP